MTVVSLAAPRFLLGAATGLLLGLLTTSLSPVIGIVAILALLIGTLNGVRPGADPSRTILMAGTLIGAGAVLVYGAINTFAACSATIDFCGDANLWPSAALAAATFGVGMVVAPVAVFRTSG
jgi:hypothetical protein